MLKIIKQLTSVVAMFAVLFAFSTETMAAKKSKTLENTKKRGFVRCGVSQGLPGFSNADESGNWTGIDVDVCRAVAAATLGDATKVKFTPLSAKERFTALTSGEIDILSRNTTWTLSRDADIGLTFVGVNFSFHLVVGHLMIHIQMLGQLIVKLDLSQLDSLMTFLELKNKQLTLLRLHSQ
jgi:general L-amino acid transport system substrate-binding protein